MQVQTLPVSATFPIHGPNLRPYVFAYLRDTLMIGCDGGLFMLWGGTRLDLYHFSLQPLHMTATDKDLIAVDAVSKVFYREPLLSSAGTGTKSLREIPTGLAMGFGEVWVAYRDGTIENHTGTRSVSIGGTPGLMFFDGVNLWVAHQETARNGKSYLSKL